MNVCFVKNLWWDLEVCEGGEIWVLIQVVVLGYIDVVEIFVDVNSVLLVEYDIVVQI